MAAARDETFDVVVAGGGPAGATAAARAASQGLRVVLLERPAAAATPRGAGWISPAGVELCRALGLTTRTAGITQFRGLCLHAWDCRRKTEVTDEALTGWLAERPALDEALRAAAVAAGARLRRDVEIESLALGEADVRVRGKAGETIAARVLVIADGARSTVAGLARMRAAAQAAGAPRCAHVGLPGGPAALELILENRRRGMLATIVRTKETTTLSVLARDAAVDVTRETEALVRTAQAAGMLPKSAAPPRVESVISPAGVALDIESHVGKRCLMIGDAGGFVSAFSNEGIYPAMRSGWIAADTIARGLKARVLQDELAGFDAAWRGDLAERLRPPNTDLSLLLPLVFGNKQMSLRVASAFLLGQPF